MRRATADDMPLGEAEVTVCVDEEASVAHPSPHYWTGKELLEWLERERKEHPRTWIPRTKEEVDAEINALRDEWDR